MPLLLQVEVATPVVCVGLMRSPTSSRLSEVDLGLEFYYFSGNIPAFIAAYSWTQIKVSLNSLFLHYCPLPESYL